LPEYDAIHLHRPLDVLQLNLADARQELGNNLVVYLIEHLLCDHDPTRICRLLASSGRPLSQIAQELGVAALRLSTMRTFLAPRSAIRHGGILLSYAFLSKLSRRLASYFPAILLY
jgi:hypothetical protein